MNQSLNVKTNLERWKAPFFAVWTGQQLSLIGSYVARFALVWWLTQSTGSATVLATATLVAMLPDILVAPFVGALVDRWNRQKIMIVADGFIALMSALLAFLFWTGSLQIWHVYVLLLARSLGGTFHRPAMGASTSLMVPQEHLSRVSGANSTVQGLLTIVGPPLGALLMSTLPLHGVMLVDVVTAALAIAPLFFVRIPQPQRQPTAATDKPSFGDDMREGLRYVWGWPGLCMLLGMSMLINFVLSPIGSLMPVLVIRHFGGQVLHLGWLNSAYGIGVVLGGAILGIWGGFRRRVVTTLVGIVGIGAGALVVGLAPARAFWLALVGLFVAGFMVPMNQAIVATLQAKIAPEMQGRVFTVVQSIMIAMAPLSMAVAGPVSDALGVQAWWVAGGVVCLVAGLVGFSVPAIVRLEDDSPAVNELASKRADADPESAMTVSAS